MTLSLPQLYHNPAVTHRILGDDTQLALEGNTFNELDFSGDYELAIEYGPIQRAPQNGVYIYRGVLLSHSDAIGILSNTDGSEAVVRPVVIKVASTQDSFQQLVDEGRFYAKYLADALYRRPVATCLGAYRVASSITDGKATGCLLLEDCGSSLRTFDSENASRRDIVRFNILLIEIVMDLHRTGVSHGEIAPRHVAVFDKNPYIVGFSADRATLNYQCSCQGKRAEDVWSLKVGPRRDTFGCNELYDLCNALAIWGSTTFTCHGLTIYVKDLNNLEYLELVASRKSSYIEYDEALEMVYDAAGEYLDAVAPNCEYAQAIKAVKENGFKDYCREYKNRKEAEPEDTTLD